MLRRDTMETRLSRRRFESRGNVATFDGTGELGKYFVGSIKKTLDMVLLMRESRVKPRSG